MLRPLFWFHISPKRGRPKCPQDDWEVGDELYHRGQYEDSEFKDELLARVHKKGVFDHEGFTPEGEYVAVDEDYEWLEQDAWNWVNDARGRKEESTAFVLEYVHPEFLETWPDDSIPKLQDRYSCWVEDLYKKKEQE